MSTEIPPARQDLEACLRQLISALDAVDPASPVDAKARLEASHPFDGPDVTRA